MHTRRRLLSFLGAVPGLAFLSGAARAEEQHTPRALPESPVVRVLKGDFERTVVGRFPLPPGRTLDLTVTVAIRTPTFDHVLHRYGTVSTRWGEARLAGDWVQFDRRVDAPPPPPEPAQPGEVTLAMAISIWPTPCAELEVAAEGDHLVAVLTRVKDDLDAICTFKVTDFGFP